MRILHLLYESKGDYFGIGGAGIRAYEIYGYLKDRHDITLLCKKYPGASDGEIEGLRHLFVGAESESLTRTLLSYAYHSVRFVREHGKEFDIIIEDFSPAIPTFLHSFTKKPVVLQVQGYTGKLYFKKYNPLYALTLHALEMLRPRFYDNFIFMQQEIARRLLRRSGKHTEIISSAVSHELLNAFPVDGDYILYMGRIDIYGKGLDTLIEAYREFHVSYPDIRLVIAGDGKDRERFKAMLTGLPEDVKKDIELRGWISGDEKRTAITSALLCVFPSRHEVQPIALLEALAGGKAVVVSGIPEFHFVVEKRAGISFETGSAISLAHSMKNLMTNNERKEMGQRGREWVKDFTWDKIARSFELFLNEVVEEGEKCTPKAY